jgi:translocator protein
MTSSLSNFSNSCETTGLPILKDKHLWFYSIIVAIIAIIAAIIISKGIQTDLYQNLNKPSWIPDPLSFSIIWIINYIFIAYVWFVADRVSDCSMHSRTSINILFALNLFLNISWVYLFFGAVNMGAALTIAIFLLVLTLYMVWYLSKLNKMAAMLFCIYSILLLIVIFMNYSIYSNN